MKTVLSQDGAAIAFDRSGSGAPVILVDGMLRFTDKVTLIMAPYTIHY